MLVGIVYLCDTRKKLSRTNLFRSGLTPVGLQHNLLQETVSDWMREHSSTLKRKTNSPLRLFHVDARFHLEDAAGG